MDQEALLVGKAADQHPEKRNVLTISCILASQALEKLAYYGLVPNMILYLTAEYGMGTTEAANILFLWSAATNFFPLIGAFIADSYTGRFPLIGFGSSTSLLGMLLLWLATMIQPECDKSIHVCQPTTPFQLLLLYSFFTLTSIGAGGVRSSCLAFAADQLQLNHTSRISTSALETLFNWYYFSVMLAYFLSESLLVFVQTKYGWQIGFGVSLAAMTISVALFFAASPYYVKFKCEPGLVSGLVQVLVAAFRNRHVDLSSEEHVVSYHQETGSSFSTPSQKLRYLNKACATSNPKQDLTVTRNSRSPRKLCTVQQVEDLKSLVNLLPIWSTGIILSLVTACQASFIVLQAKAMDRRTFIKSFEIPPGCYGVFMIISFVLFLVIYDLVVVPLVSWAQRKPFRLGVMVRMGAGIAISVLCILTLAIVEYARRKRAREEGGTVLSAMWLLPYMLLGGISEALISIAQNEFFYSELPKSMSSVATTLFGLNMAAASLVSSWIVTAVDAATCGSWITKDINEGHLDYYYWLLTALSLLNVAYFVWCSKAYGKCKSDADN
ncbi:Protein NRT1/ PTR FAMILY 1.3 [Raphanus sativus]|nr:Protein NRT1/ PTR FAMILY 1.3 [Raphanus sativus]